MKSLQVMIADDEPLSLERMALLLASQEGVNVVGQAQNGSEALDFLKNHDVDAVFLDIRMPGLSGLDLAGLLKDRKLAVVLVSAYDQHAIDAFDLNVTDYITKPVRPSRLAQALDKIRSSRNPQEVAKIAISVGEGLILVNVTDIIYAQVRNGSLELICGARTHYPNWSLKQLQEKLAHHDQFLKVSRQALINTECLKAIKPHFSGTSLLTLGDGTKIEASRSCTRMLKAKFEF